MTAVGGLLLLDSQSSAVRIRIFAGRIAAPETDIQGLTRSRVYRTTGQVPFKRDPLWGPPIGPSYRGSTSNSK